MDHSLQSSSVYPNDVSPPATPHVHEAKTSRSRRSSPDVSPISESPSPVTGRSPVFASQRFNSNIPVAKRTRKFWNRPSIGSQEQGPGLTHWDVYSGEPTTSEKGKPPQTTPSAVRSNTQPDIGRLNGGYGTYTHITGGSAIGRKRIASRDLNNGFLVRPEWKGAGGRHKIVNPLLDKPLPPGVSPTFPAGRAKHQYDQGENKRSANLKASCPLPKPWATEKTDLQSQPSIVLDPTASDQRVSPNDDKFDSSPDLLTPPTHQNSTQTRHLILSAEDARSPLARNPSNEEMQERRSQDFSDSPQSSTTEARHSHVDESEARHSEATPSTLPKSNWEEQDSSQIESRFRADLQHMHLEDEPPSRFSATTYATTTPNSPPTTPELGSDSPGMSTTSNSILNRKRPVPPAGLPNPRITARKPTPSELGIPKQAPESRRKSLPKSPPEKQAISRVASLQAKLDNLRHRRNNLESVIHELTHVVQPSSIAYDVAARQEIKRSVEGLSRELAEVLKDEHESGLKLHRALKRDDEFAAYEPTSIWVRRVTS